jgi:hypothetical protein
MNSRSLRALLVPVVISLQIALWGGGAEGANAAAESAATANPTQDPLGRTCELGITYALSHEEAAAESVFVSLLSRSPGDARALNNLGNLRLLRGDVDVALAFYARAGQADSMDAGIPLNESVALMIGGYEDAARERAAEGARRAGGPDEAARLLGLRYAASDDGNPAAGDPAQVSRNEVLALLRAATQAVPVDSTHTTHAAAAGKTPGKPAPAWRSAGARGAAGSDVGAVIYWKR